MVILVMATAIFLMSITVETQTNSEPFTEGQSTEEEHHISLEWPRFAPGETPQWQALNQEVALYSDSICLQFKEEGDPGEEGKLMGDYEVIYLSEDLLSLRLDYHYDFLDARDEEHFQTKFFNLDMTTGSPLSFTESFKLKSSIEDWVSFVEETGQDIDPQHPLPENFLFNEDGVDLFFPNLESEASFGWAAMATHFEIASPLPLN